MAKTVDRHIIHKSVVYAPGDVIPDDLVARLKGSGRSSLLVDLDQPEPVTVEPEPAISLDPVGEAVVPDALLSHVPRKARDVIEWASGNATAIDAALEVEYARPNGPRKSVIEALDGFNS